MYRIKYKIMALGLALIMCASVLVAAFLPEGSSASRPTASASQGLKLEEDDSMKLADTSSAFDESIVHIAEEVSGEHWLIVSLEGESLSESRGSASVAEYTSSARGKRAEKRLRNAQSDFLTDLRAEGIPFTYKYGYTLLTNAVAIKTDVKYAEDIASIDGVKSVDISEHYYAPKDIPVENEANVWGTGIYKVDGAAAEYDGAGMVAAILDTGLDSSHEVFQTMPENEDLLMTKEDVQRLVFEGSKNEGVLSIDPTVTVDDVYINEKVPFAYDYADKHADVYPSYSSHGTHVAGIIAGSPYLDENGEPAYIKDQDGNEILDKNGQPMEFRGVAPEAQLVICKVFSDEEENGTVGGADELDILAALEDCVKLGVDVINMSLGSSAGFSTGDNEHMQTVYTNVRKAGISLVVAASNDYSAHYGGAYGTNLTENPDSATVGSPSTYPEALSVASINGQQASYIKVVANGEDKFLYFTEASDGNGNEKDFVEEIMKNNPDKVKNGVMEVEYQVVPGYGLSVNYTRNIDVRGKIAVVRRGGNVNFEEKVRVAKQRGAIGCVIYNNVSGIIRMSLGNLSDPIPTCSITMDAGDILRAADKGTMYISASQKAGPFMSDFSSWGPTPELSLKPEISAHGGEITSSVANGWAEYSGTSMAAPNMAGVMSLMLSYVRQNESVFQYQEGNINQDSVAMANFLVMSTATIAKDEYNRPYSPRKQGAGLADVEKAVTTKAYLYSEGMDKAKIEVGDDPDMKGVYNLEFHAKNVSDKARTYTLGTQTMTETVSSDGLTVAERAYMLDDMADITFKVDGKESGKEITLAAGADVLISVTIRLHDDAIDYIRDNFENGMYVEGFVTLEDTTGDGSEVDLNIPWLGFCGDWYAAPMFDVSEYEVEASLADDSVPDDEKLEAAIYPTVPVGSYWNEQYVIPLGTYLYPQDADVRQIYSTSDKAAISIYDSETRHTVSQLSGVYAGLLRGAKEMHVTITDAASGEVVFEKTQHNLRKTYTGGSSSAYASFVELDFNAAELGLENNRRYLVHMEGEMATLVSGRENTNDNGGNTFDFEFYVDTEAPEIVDYRVRYEQYRDENENIRYNVYLDVDVYDNHYAQSIALCFADYTTMSLQMLETMMTPVYSERNSVTTVSLDITDYYDKDVDLYIQVDDYALNARAYRVSSFKPLGDAVTYPDSVEIVTGTDADDPDYSKEVTIGVNEALTLEMQVEPADTASANLYWHSFDESIVRVENGEIFGVSPGSAVVRVYAGKDESAEVSDAILVTVKESDIAAPGITRLELDLIENTENNLVDPTNATVEVHPNKAFRLKAIAEPWYSTAELNIVWQSSSPSIATVNAETGYVRTLAEGTAVITGTLYVNGRPSLYAVSTTLSVGPEFVVNNGTLMEYHGAGGKVTIPKSLNIYTIYEDAFQNNTNITELEISAPCSVIQSFAFSNMKALKRVILPDTVEYVFRYAFYGCPNLERIDLHSRSITFGDNCFENCTSLKYINNVALYLEGDLTAEDVEILSLPEAVDGQPAPQGNYFKRIPANMTTIGTQTFAGCTSLEELDITELRVAGQGAFYKCTNLKSVTLSRFTAVSDDMFLDCAKLHKLIYTDVTPSDLSSITYPNSVSPFGGCSIDTIQFGVGSDSFVVGQQGNANILYSDESKTEIVKVFGSGITSFEVPAQVETIAANAFSGIESLRTVTFAGSALRSIGAYAFSGTGIRSLVIPANVTSIGKGAFSWCDDLTSVDLSAFAGVIPEAAFSNSLVERVTFGSNITEIGAEAFLYTALSEVDLSGTAVHTIGSNAFALCPYLSEVRLGAVTELGSGVFAYGGALEKVTFGDGSSALGTETFAEQALLSEVVLPSGMRSIDVGSGVFRGCASLQTLALQPLSAGDGAFENCVSLRELDLSALQTAGDAAFKNCAALAMGSFPALTQAGDEAFYGCAKLQTADMPKVTKIGARAFVASAVSAVNYPMIEIVGNYAFANTALTGENGVLTIPSGIVSSYTATRPVDPGEGEKDEQLLYSGIGEGAYSGLKNVTAFAIADNEKYFADAASGILYERVGNGVQVIAYPAGRDGDKADGVVTLREDTVRVGASAFENASKVKTVAFPYVFSAIGDKAFFGCGATRYEFGCLTAPILETGVLSASDFETGSDMYLILSDEGDIASDKFYANFKDYVALKLFAGQDGVKGIEDFGLTVVCPQNASGFDGRIYKEYFSTLERSELIADDTARTALSLIGELPSAQEVEALDGTETALWKQYREKASAAREAYNLVTATQSVFVTNADKLFETEAAMRAAAAKFGETVKMQSISVTTAPNKTVYLRGEKFDPTGLVLTLVWSDGSRENISSGYTVENADEPLTLTNRTVRIRYEGLTTTLNLTVGKPAVESIAVETYPASQAYRPGDTYVSSGLVLRVTYVDGEEELVYTSSINGSDGYVVEAPVLQAGDNTITVTYGGKTTTYVVTVQAASETPGTDDEKPPVQTPDEDGLEGWMIALIVVGAVIVLGGAAVLVLVLLKKKAASAVENVADASDEEESGEDHKE